MPEMWELPQAQSDAEIITNLLPCPFCGFNVAKTTYVRDGRRACCGNCGANAGPKHHGPPTIPTAEERAIAAWNTRAAPWQPIETAPRDGKDILVFGNGFVRKAFWDDARGGQWSEWPGREMIVATRWMHLPPPPEET